MRLGFVFALIQPVLWSSAQDFRVLEYDPIAINEKVFTSLTQTPDGFMWFGSYGALAVFDGTTYRYFMSDPNDSASVTYGDFHQLAYDPRGFIWAGSNMGGLSRLDIRTGKALTWLSNPSDETTITGDRVSGLTVDRSGNTWVATDNFGLTRIDRHNKITRFYPPQPGAAKDIRDAGSLQEIIQDAEEPDLFWVASKYGIYRFYPARQSFQLIPAVRDGHEIVQAFEDVVQDGHGRLWMSSGTEGLWCYNPEDNTWKQYKVVMGRNETRGTNLIYELICTRDNHIMCATNSDGIWIVDANTDVFTQFVSPAPEYDNIFTSNRVILEDPRGDIWTGQRGLLRLTKHTPPFAFFPFRPYVSDKSQGNWQRQYIDDPVTGNFFVATTTGDGLLEAHITSGEVIVHRYRPDVSAYDVNMESITLAADTGVWIGSYEGLLYYDRATGHISKVAPADAKLASFMQDLIRSMVVNDKGELLMAAEHQGLVRWNPRSGEWTQVIGSRGASGILREVRIAPNGAVWVAFEHDVGVIDPHTGALRLLPRTKKGGNGLYMNAVRDIQIDASGDVWVSTINGGINRVRTHADGSFEYIHYTTQNGLPTNLAYEMVVGHDGRIWAGTRMGISVIDPETHVIISYRASDGLGFNARSGPLFQLASGEILTGGRGGFHFAHVDSLRGRAPIPSPYLYLVETADSARLAMFGNETRLRIGPSDNFFAVTWGALAFDETPTTRFAYMLDGFDDDWIFAGDRTFARYSKLPGGSYTFKVKAVNDKGEWSNALASLHVKVIPPFTKTPWFYMLMALGFIVLVYAFYRIRVRQVRRESELKTQFEKELAHVEMQALRAQMNPHFLFNSLNSINRFIVKNDSKAASKYLTRFSRLIRLILDNSKATKVTLANELEAIRLYVELESLRFDERFSFELHVDDNVEAENIEIDSMILQPYIENAIWHGLMHKDGHGTLKVDISRIGATLHCVVEDDGVGRLRAGEMNSKTATKEKSYGMKITSDRLRMLNRENHAGASVKVHDLVAPDGEPMGTRVEITLPC